MRTTRIDVEGEQGEATITKKHGEIEIEITKRGKTTYVTAPADDPARIGMAARTTQMHCDGYDGSAGDVADYRRMIECFAE